MMTADCKHSHVWNFFSSQNSIDAVCDVCGRTVRSCGNTTNLVKHLRFNHSTECDAVLQRRSEEDEKKGAAEEERQTSLTESFGSCRRDPGTEGDRVRHSLCVDVQTTRVPRIHKTTECRFIQTDINSYAGLINTHG